MRWPGQARKIEELVETHYASLYRYAYRLSGARAEAEDLTQETFCQARRKLPQLRDWDKAKAWLYAILRNAFLHRVRDARTENCVALEDVGELPDRLPAPLPEIEPAKLQEALNELPEGFRTPLILFYFEDFSYREIADHLDVPIGTVMSRLARGKGYLKARLQRPAYATIAANGKEDG